MSDKPNLPVHREGKTKIFFDLPDEPGHVLGWSKDDITAGDGKKHDILDGKAVYSNETTCNTFELLKACGIPLAYVRRHDERSLVALKTDMIPLEVVVRRRAWGSALEREPHLEQGLVFPKLRFEYFLKTKDKKWREVDLPCDDPYLRTLGDNLQLFDPHKPLQKPFFVLKCSQDGQLGLLRKMGIFEQGETNPLYKPTMTAFLTLEKAWQIVGGDLIDFKVEFGCRLPLCTDCYRPVISDVIDADSCRVLYGGHHIDKQNYRNGESLTKVKAGLAKAMELSGQFRLPRQRIIIWRASRDDKIQEIEEALNSFKGVEYVVEDGSAHKETVQCLRINKMIQECPDTVVIAEVGKSNGLGPMLASNLTVPVITRPSTWKEFPDDVWSSLRGPSTCPVMTVLEPKNAVLAALTILAGRNPLIYSRIRYEREKKLTNFMVLD